MTHLQQSIDKEALLPLLLLCLFLLLLCNGHPFTTSTRPFPNGLRLAYSSDLGGVCPMDPLVDGICSEAAQWFSRHIDGTVVMNDCPDLANVREAERLHHHQHYYNCYTTFTFPIL